MNAEATRKHDPSKTRDIAEKLARETNTPVEQVAEIYATQAAELERTARIKTFIDVLVTRRTRILLNGRTAP
jgi:hypothetical protein